ncbi:carbamoyl phosphate synthase small subunit [Candidatus Vidania fulgoroideorum]
MNKSNCKIIFSDGKEFYGRSLCYKTNFFNEIVFNTSNLGYEEIITDPSYSNQSLVLTTPYVGNTGFNYQDLESNRIWLSCMITRSFFNLRSNNFRSVNKLLFYLKKNKIVLLENFDTRSITKKIIKGFNYVYILHNKILKVKNFFFKKSIENIPYIKYTSTKINYLYCNFEHIYKNKRVFFYNKKVIVIDFGLKTSILKNLVKRNIFLLIINYKNFKDIYLRIFDGFVLTNGPGNPKTYYKIIRLIKKINKPILAICLGHQLYSLSNNIKIKRLKFGHHGSNHPINFLKKCFISSQNHNYYCDNKTKIFSLFDKTNQGIIKKNIISFQGHPEACPGPNDFSFIFKKFYKIL